MGYLPDLSISFSASDCVPSSDLHAASVRFFHQRRPFGGEHGVLRDLLRSDAIGADILPEHLGAREQGAGLEAPMVSGGDVDARRTAQHRPGQYPPDGRSQLEAVAGEAVGGHELLPPPGSPARSPFASMMRKGAVSVSPRRGGWYAPCTADARARSSGPKYRILRWRRPPGATMRRLPQIELA